MIVERGTFGFPEEAFVCRERDFAGGAGGLGIRIRIVVSEPDVAATAEPGKRMVCVCVSLSGPGEVTLIEPA